MPRRESLPMLEGFCSRCGPHRAAEPRGPHECPACGLVLLRVREIGRAFLQFDWTRHDPEGRQRRKRWNNRFLFGGRGYSTSPVQDK